MKLLTKVKIINWHYFWDETIEVKPLVFLTGANASGKSTLIDALQIVLLGDTTGRYFNKAAMDKSARTLRGYLRGEIGDTIDGGFKYLRNGRFTSYIALEFHNDVDNTDFVMGIVFDSYEDGTEEHRYFCLDDKIPENEFIINKIPMDYKTLSKYFNEFYKEKYKFFDSNRSYQDFLKKKFGGLKDKYFSLLKKATSFNPITDITTFITEYVCDPQANINLDILQENILEYKRLEEEAKTIEGRVNDLEEIENTYKEYLKNKKNLTISQYIVERCDLERSKERLKAYQSQIDKNKERINQIDLELADFSENLASLNRKKVALIQDKASNSTQKLTEELYRTKNETLAEIKEIEQTEKNLIRTLTLTLDSYINASKGIVDNLSDFDVQSVEEDKAEEIIALVEESKKTYSYTVEFKSKYLKDLNTISKDVLDSLKSIMLSFKQKVSSLAITLARTISNIDKKIRALRDEEISMKQGQKPYSAVLVRIKNELEKMLEEKYGKHIEVNIFADLIDIKDMSWSNAIEGYLSGQKFNLFVAPKYYIDAYNCLKKLLSTYQFYGTALVDQERIIERDYKCENNSLAEEIITDDEGARAYCNFLIGRLYKANNVVEARNYGNGITKECDLYRNFVLTRINPRLYQESFIGRALNDRFFIEKSNQLKNNIANASLYRKLSELITEANNLEILSSGDIESILKDINKLNSLDGLKATLDYVNEELSTHDTTLLESLDRRIKDVEEDIASIEKDRETSLLEKGQLNKEIQTIIDEKMASEKQNIKAIEDNLNSKYDPFLVNDEALPILNKQLEEKKSILEIYQSFSVSSSRLLYTVNSIFSQLTRLRRDYVSKYHLTYQVEATNNDEFENELNDFKEVKLPSYKEKIEDSYHKATQQFKDDFIFKIRGAIEDAKDQIENLNVALKQSLFGKDLYRFTVKPNQQYRRFYDMLMDDLILNIEKDETEFVEKYKDTMNELFQQIVDDGNNDAKKNNELIANVEKFTDYRSYLDFDLIVTNKETNEEQRLSKMIKKKSGGETQTPFYIAILASFSQLYHANEEGNIANTTRLIIFDEAFSKMDPTRFKEAVRLLRKFNLQVILSAPSDKVGKISELVDETLVVLHDKNRSFVKLFAKE